MSYVCTRDVNGWELYDEKGANEAARTISKAVTERVSAAKRLLAENALLSEEKMAQKVYGEVYEVLRTYSDLGALDTEPRNALLDEIERAFGLDPFTLDA